MTTLTRQRPVWAETPSLVERIAKALVLTGIALAVLFPIYVVVLTSFSPASAINEAGGLVVIPRGFSLAAYAELFAGGVVTRAVAVSVGVTVVGTAISLSATILAAYGKALAAAGGYQFPKSQTPWQAIQRSLVGQLESGAILEGAEQFQRIAQTAGLPRDSH